jgi:hypothetical protein
MRKPKQNLPSSFSSSFLCRPEEKRREEKRRDGVIELTFLYLLHDVV